MGDPVVATGFIRSRDCPVGQRPIPSLNQEAYGARLFVTGCLSCPTGDFSPGVNAECQRCPQGASSAAARGTSGPSGLASCFCPGGKYFQSWKYKGADSNRQSWDGSKPLQCGGCDTACKGTTKNCGRCEPWTSSGPSRNPMPKSGFWAPVPIDQWSSSTFIYSCPY